MYLELFGFKVEANEGNIDSEPHLESDEKIDELPYSAFGDSIACKYKIQGSLDLKAIQFVNDNFDFIEKAYESHQSKDLHALQMLGQKVFPEILKLLGIDLSLVNDINPIGAHDTGIFTSKFITFKLQQLEFENRESRLSLVTRILRVVALCLLVFAFSFVCVCC